MVALMRFTRNICRFLGLGSGSIDQTPEEIGNDATSDHNMDALSQNGLNGEDGLSEEERARRRAERRRAKRKRQRERKKLERVKNDEHIMQGEKGHGEVDSELEDSVSEAEELLEEEEEDEKVKEQEDMEVKEKVVDKACPPYEGSSVPPLASENKGNWQPLASACEEEPEWDVSSAFVANAVSHIRPKAKSKAGRKSKENKENEAKDKDEFAPDSVSKRSASLTEKGIRLVQEGQYNLAVSMFTEAIKYDPKDYRYFGNRSYCYYCLDQYALALADAEKSIQMAPDWPKGYYRKGSALMGLKRYEEAEKAMEQVLRLDKDCEEAVDDLYSCKVLQLMDLGYEEEQSVQLLEKYSTVQAVLAARANYESTLLQPGSPCPSLWVGNVTTELTEKHLWDLFKNYGEIESMRVLHERFCAFVNFKNASMASRALEKLNGYLIENTRLVIRYPDRRVQKSFPVPTATQATGADGARRRGPVNGDECYFWRTTGCHFGDKCHYKHLPEHRGKDRKPWQP